MLLEAKIIKMKKSEKGETNAIHVSEKIIFTEYYLHSQIITKMKIFCMNALFAFRIKITVGDTFIFGVAQATAMRLFALPLPPPVSVKLKKKKIQDQYMGSANSVEAVSRAYMQIAKLSQIRETSM